VKEEEGPAGAKALEEMQRFGTTEVVPSQGEGDRNCGNRSKSRIAGFLDLGGGTP
jgi:hypothetical protein